MDNRQIPLQEPTVDLPEGVVDPLATAVAKALPHLIARIPPTPAAELGRIAAYSSHGAISDAVSDVPPGTPRASGVSGTTGASGVVLPGSAVPRGQTRLADTVPSTGRAAVLAALRSIGPQLPERLLGALELAVDELPLYAPRGLTRNLPGAPSMAGFSMIAPIGEAEAVHAVAVLDQIHPHVSGLIHAFVHALADRPALAPFLAPSPAPSPVPFFASFPAADDPTASANHGVDHSADHSADHGPIIEPGDEPADEFTVAARHGAGYLALAVAVATAVLRELDLPSVHAGAPVVVGAALGCVALVLPDRPVPAASPAALPASPAALPASPAALPARHRADHQPPRSAYGARQGGDHCSGIVEGTPPATTAPETRYRWVRRRSAFREAATLTVVVGATPEEVVRCFGADLDSPRSLAAPGTGDGLSSGLAVLALDDEVVLAVEDNGNQGSRHPVLAAVSRRGLAGSMFWNINALTRLSLARGGDVLAAFEPGLDAIPDAMVPLLHDLDLAGALDRVAAGLVVVERFTGHAILPEHLARIIENDVAYPLGGGVADGYRGGRGSQPGGREQSGRRMV